MTGASGEGANTDDSMTVSVLTAVSDRDGRDVTDLPPLSDVVDPDAIETLFSSTGPRRSAVDSLTFPYAGYTVGVDAEGTVTVTDGERHYP